MARSWLCSSARVKKSGCGAAEGEASVQSVSMICGLGSVGLADRFAGIVSPLGETTIKKNDAMTIDTIKVKVGDSVKKGDVLFTLSAEDAARFPRALDALEGAYEIGDAGSGILTGGPLIAGRVGAE